MNVKFRIVNVMHINRVNERSVNVENYRFNIVEIPLFIVSSIRRRGEF